MIYLVKIRLLRKKLIKPLLIITIKKLLLQIYNVFINDFDKFSKVMDKKEPGTKGPNQKDLLNYGNEF